MIIQSYANEISIKASAKINLTLEIGKTRPDGFHDILSVVQEIGLHDLVTIKKNINKNGISIKSNSNVIPLDPENIAFKAASIFMRSTGLDCGIDIHIQKNIPICAGLGGGSSDAAAVFLGLRELFKCEVCDEELCIMASRVGSDVPFFIYGGTAIMRGRGEEIISINKMPKTELVIVKPNFDISTKEAYTTWDKFNLAQTKLIKTYNMVKFINEIGKKSEIEMISKYMHNDFETITKNLYPEIIRLKDILSSLGAFAVQLTGTHL